jgi:hypothetical protein
MVKARWIWCKYDQDEDGIAELIHVLRVGDEILELDYATRIPVSSMVPFINTHRHMGNSVSDLVFDIQRIKTAILRQGLDSLFYSQQPQYAHSNKVELDDLHVRKPAGTVSIDTDLPDVAGHLFQMSTEFVFPQAQEGLRHMDTVTESRVGVNRMFQGIDEGNLNHHDRIGKLTTMAAQRIEQIARIMGNGVQNLFSICHELVIRHGHQAESIKLRGEWVQFDPKQWRTGRDMRVVAPYAAGNKDSLLERLMVVKGAMSEIIQAQANGVMQPMVMADNVYNMMLDMAAAADLTGNKYVTDPATIPPPEPQPDPTLIALDIEKQKADNQSEDNEIDRVKIETDAMTDLKKAEIASHTAIAVALINQGGSIDAENIRQAASNARANKAGKDSATNTDAIVGVNSSINESLEALMTAIASLNAPKRVVKDEDGNIVGVEPVGEETDS